MARMDGGLSPMVKEAGGGRLLLRIGGGCREWAGLFRALMRPGGGIGSGRGITKGLPETTWDYEISGGGGGGTLNGPPCAAK